MEIHVNVMWFLPILYILIGLVGATMVHGSSIKDKSDRSFIGALTFLFWPVMFIIFFLVLAPKHLSEKFTGKDGNRDSW